MLFSRLVYTYMVPFMANTTLYWVSELELDQLHIYPTVDCPDCGLINYGLMKEFLLTQSWIDG